MASGHGSKEERLREATIAALLTGVTIPEAARIVGVDPSTIDGWLKKPEFQQAYAAARRQIVEQAIGLLVGAVRDAVATLKRNLNCGSPSTEVRAALGLIDQAFRGHEMADIAGRMDELEACLKAANGGAS